MGNVEISGQELYCEISDSKNPRPLVPKQCRDVIINLVHHQDHPNHKETLRRIAKDYYWPCMKKDVEGFCRTCHPCQLAKQSRTVDPGSGFFEVPDQRFSAIHLDVVGPLPESEGMRYLLTTFCRTSRWLEAFPMASASSEQSFYEAHSEVWCSETGNFRQWQYVYCKFISRYNEDIRN